MKCILNYCGGSISLHCNFWHVTFDAWTRDIGCVARELDWELVTSKITGLMPFAYCIGGVFSSVYLGVLVKKTFVSCMYFALVAFDEGERILILPWAQAGCQIDLRDFRPGDRLAASTSCATVSDMVTKLCFALVSTSGTLPTSNSVSFSTSNCVQQTTKSVNRSR